MNFVTFTVGDCHQIGFIGDLDLIFFDRLLLWDNGRCSEYQVLLEIAGNLWAHSLDRQFLHHQIRAFVHRQSGVPSVLTLRH